MWQSFRNQVTVSFSKNPADLLDKLGPWAFFLCILPLGLAARELGFLSLLLPIVAAMGVVLLLMIVSDDWAKRLLALDLIAVLMVGLIAVYFTAIGDPTELELAVILAGILVAGSAVYVWYLQREVEGGSLTSTHGSARRLISRALPCLHWNRALAFTIVILLLTFVTCLWAFGGSVRILAYTWLVSTFSFGAFLFISAACTVGGRFGLVLTLVSLLALEAAAVWYIASTEVATYQAYPLLWNDLVTRARDPSAKGILVEGLLSLPAAVLTVGVFAGFALLARVLGRLRRRTCFWALIRIVTLVLVGGSLLVGQRRLITPRLAERYLELSSAPWSAVHRRERGASRMDFEKAAAWKSRLTPPIWAEGPAVPLASLAGRYQGRSIVLIVMESHSPNNMAGFGEGAYRYQPSSPRLTQLVSESLSFRNYFSSGFATRDALWAILTGLPVPSGSPPAVQRAPEAARLGRMRDFIALGYRCEWLCPGSPHFDNWDLLMSAAGVRWWIENEELRGLSREYWTSWGMPDGDLYAVASRRYRESLVGAQPTFTGILTISNHTPYSFPAAVEGRDLPQDHIGGTRYADYAAGEFVQGLRALPCDQRPIVFITADTSYIQNLHDAEPAGHFGLEGARVPGLLLLPDGYLAGQVYQGVFCHEDLLDLLYFLVLPDGRDRVPKFAARHRNVAFVNGHQIFTSDTYYAASFDRWFVIEDHWRLEETSSPPQRRLVEKAWERFLEDTKLLWPVEP